MTRTVVESQTRTAVIGFEEPFCVIGERINPTGRKKLAAELEAGDFSTVEADAVAQVACGAAILDVNAGVVRRGADEVQEDEEPGQESHASEPNGAPPTHAERACPL